MVERGDASVEHPAIEVVNRAWSELHGLVKLSFMLGATAMSQNLRLALSYESNASQPIPEPCVIPRGPGKTHGHEELDELGTIALNQDIDYPAL